MFTLSGGHVFPLYDAAHSAGLRIVDVRHEQSAVFAAEAVAKLQRRPGLAVLTAGPGVTNGISGLTSAHFNAASVVVLGGRAAAVTALTAHRGPVFLDFPLEVMCGAGTGEVAEPEIPLVEPDPDEVVRA